MAGMTMLVLFFVVHGFTDGYDRYLFSNFDIQPRFATSNSTSTSIFQCTKQTDDHHGFEVTTIPVISSDHLKIYERRRNKTAMDILIDSSGFIGAFILICSSIDNHSVGIPADVYIGNPPGEFRLLKPCMIHENRYIDCVIQMPNMISAIQNEYPYSFDFREIHRSLNEDNAYNQPGEVVKIDEENQMITFRWFPVEENVFPSKVKMFISGTLKYFGTTNLTIDMTPNNWIRPNVTIDKVTSSSFEIQIQHDLPLSCRGNLTIDDHPQIRHQRDDVRRFSTTNRSVIYIKDLNANTWYQLCIQCQRNTSLKTIREVQCLRKQTKRSWVWLMYSSLPIVLIITLIIAILIYRCRRCINSSPKSKDSTHPEIITQDDERGNILLSMIPVSEQSATRAAPNGETHV